MNEHRLFNRLAANRSTRTLLSRDDHGNHRCYVAGCRCDPCTDAETAYARHRKLVRHDPRRWWRRPLVWCRTDFHERCPVLSAGKRCPCVCHVGAA